MVIVIDEAEAEVVRRVFALFLAGHGYKAIAARLNQEGVAAPHDGGKGKKHGSGWGASTIRAVLLNRRYIGEQTWNSTKWVRMPGKKYRKPVARPESERITRVVPELAIIDADTFDQVQDRFRRNKTKGRPAASGKTPHLLTGILKCGVCGGSMSICGSKVKNGIRYVSYRCANNSARGTCANDLSISETKITSAVFDAIRDVLTDPVVVERVAKQVERRLAAPNTSDTGTAVKLREAEDRINNLVEAIARRPSDALESKLAIEESRRDQLRQQLAKEQRTVARAVPSTQAIRTNVRRWLDSLATEGDVVRRRDLLARVLGPVTLTPKGENPGRRYVGAGVLDLAKLVSDKSSSGGVLVDLSATRVRLRFETIPGRLAA